MFGPLSLVTPLKVSQYCNQYSIGQPTYKHLVDSSVMSLFNEQCDSATPAFTLSVAALLQQTGLGAYLECRVAEAGQ
jgi:hypothetical protein